MIISILVCKCRHVGSNLLPVYLAYRLVRVHLAVVLGASELYGASGSKLLITADWWTLMFKRRK